MNIEKLKRDGHKYLYMSDNGIIFMLNNIESLNKYYCDICNIKYIESGLAEKEFLEHMKTDGYLIIDRRETLGDILFYMEIDKIEKAIGEIDEIDITDIIKERLI